MSEIKYKRLARGTRRGFAAIWSRGSLWLGPDHLLSVESSGYTETYKRFYFRDIQTIIVRKTSHRAIWNAVFAVPLIGCLSGLMICLVPQPENEPAIWTWSIFSSVLLLFLLVNNILGSACFCDLRTAVQIEPLPGLTRMPKTRRVLKKIRPLIEEAQGGPLAPESISAKMREWAASGAETTPATGGNQV